MRDCSSCRNARKINFVTGETTCEVEGDIQDIRYARNCPHYRKISFGLNDMIKELEGMNVKDLELLSNAVQAEIRFAIRGEVKA